MIKQTIQSQMIWVAIKPIMTSLYWGRYMSSIIEAEWYLCQYTRPSSSQVTALLLFEVNADLL